VCGNRRQVDDAPIAPCFHTPNHCPRQIHQTVDVRATHGVHLSEVEIFQIAPSEQAGVVDQDLDRPELGGDRLDHVAHSADVLDVGAYRQGPAAGGANLRDYRFGLAAPLAVVDCYRSTFACQAKASGPANAT
jgi:hypothetical protein